MPPPCRNNTPRNSFSTIIASSDQPCSEISEFEQRRLLHVYRTAEYLSALGLPSPLSAEDGCKVQLRFKPAKTSCEARTLKEQVEQAQKRRRIDSVDPVINKPVPADSNHEESLLIEASRLWLRETRAILLKPGLSGPVPTTSSEWHAEATRRWGCAVPAETEIQDWEQYVRSRLPMPPPPSPLDLMQERYAVDMWRMLAACTLMTRISSERIKEQTVSAFFELCPTPSLLLSAKEDTLRAILRPLGMVDSRMKTLKELSTRFLEMPSFDCGHQKGVNKIWGCGAFVVDSFQLFSKGCYNLETDDATCEDYLGWWREAKEEQKSLQSSGPDADFCDGEELKCVPTKKGCTVSSDAGKKRDPATLVNVGHSEKLQQSSLLKYFKAAS